MAVIANFLINVALWFLRSDMAKKILKNLMLLLVETTEDLRKTVSARINEAMELDLTPAEKAKYVFAKVKEAYPNVGDSVLNRLIENILPVVKEELMDTISSSLILSFLKSRILLLPLIHSVKVFI